MNSFDPAINYGPNDAGITAFTIIFAIILLVIGIWALTYLSSLLSNFFKKEE